MTKKLRGGIIGLGRIGNIHLNNLLQHPLVADVAVCDPFQKKKEEHGLQNYPTFRELIDQCRPDFVFICSPTPSHAEIIEHCCHEKIDVFCEKPVDLHLSKIRELKNIIEESGIIMHVGFNRRFDPDFASLQKKLRSGDIGDIHQVTITSRDPGLPPMEYISSSGGMFMDMTIHDFDMCRFLTGSEVKEVYAKGQIRVDPGLRDYNDIDTATTILTFENGTTCTILNSRDAKYGYDQRIEVFGSKGLLSVDNHLINHIRFANNEGQISNKPVPFFLERYAQSYIAETDDFLKTALRKGSPSVSISDALKATEIADYANKSMVKNEVIKIQN